MTNRDGLICLIDWLGVTLLTHNIKDVFELIGIPESEFVEMPRGLHGYTKQLACGDIRILSEGKADMGIHIQFSGQGCRQWETYWGKSWEQLLERLWNAGANFTRLDLAVDDIRYNNDKPFFKVADLIKRTENKLCRSKWRFADREGRIKIADGESLGHTIVFGSRISDLQLVIYEKNKERVNNGMELHDKLTAWNRAELRLSDARALAAVENILGGVPAGKIIFGILSNYINFIDNNGDKNKARWPVSQFWLDFLGDAEKLRLTSQAPDKTIPQKKSWLDTQVSATIAEVWVAMGSPGKEYFMDMIDQGLEKMTETQWMRAEQYRDMSEVELAHKLAKARDRYDQHMELREQQIIEFREKLTRDYRMSLNEERDAATSLTGE